MTEEQRYPFVFFGAAPVDWFELEEDLFSYEIRFVQAPSSDARRSIAEAWERALDPSAVELVTAFVWADRWALVRVDATAGVMPRANDDGDVIELESCCWRSSAAVFASNARLPVNSS